MIIPEVAEREEGIAQTWIFFVELSVLHNSRSLQNIIMKYNIENFAAKSGKFYFAQQRIIANH